MVGERKQVVDGIIDSVGCQIVQSFCRLLEKLFILRYIPLEVLLFDFLF